MFVFYKNEFKVLGLLMFSSRKKWKLYKVKKTFVKSILRLSKDRGGQHQTRFN